MKLWKASCLGLCLSIFLTGAAMSSMKFQGPRLGGPLADLTNSERDQFEDGKDAFAEAEGPQDGLGPVFNGTSCGQCHAAGGIGGSAPNITIARVTRIGGEENGRYSDLAEYGGPVLQSRSLKEFIRKYPIPAEVVPKQAKYVSHRITTPLFGAGLVEAIPDSEIIALSKIRQPDGIQGQVNIVLNPETGKYEVGRFGWKAQVSSLHVFAGDAYLNEMGITSDSFPHENLPQGKTIPPGADVAVDPEDGDGDVAKFTNYMRFLAPPQPKSLSLTALKGAINFVAAGCASCHTPALFTGRNAVRALSEKPVYLFSDLLLHRMGKSLADGIHQSQCDGDQFKTAPLWGLSARSFFLHDGRAKTVDQAILLHAGEAQAARDRYTRLGGKDKAALLAFLACL